MRQSAEEVAEILGLLNRATEEVHLANHDGRRMVLEVMPGYLPGKDGRTMEPAHVFRLRIGMKKES
jgi:hypothetical protein